MWVEWLENTRSVRSHIHHHVIQALCRDKLFLGMVGRYWLNKSFLQSGQMPSHVPDSGAIGRERLGVEGKGEHGRVGSRIATTSSTCRPSGMHAYSLWPPKSWKAPLASGAEQGKVGIQHLLSPSGDRRVDNSFEHSLGGINCNSSITTMVFCCMINTGTLVSLSGFVLLGVIERIVECNQCK